MDTSPARNRVDVRLRNEAAGWLASLFVHGLFACLFLLLIRSSTERPVRLERFVPVSVVELGENTVSPAEPNRATIPQEVRPQQIRIRRITRTVTAPASPDRVEAQLVALSRLKQPDTSRSQLDNSGQSDTDSMSEDATAGLYATYAVRDYIRNQVERRWMLDFAGLGNRSFVVHIRVVIAPNGAITDADILEKTRFTTDAIYRDMALRARDAVLLSSPIRLPDGQSLLPSSVTLRLDSKDMVR